MNLWYFYSFGSISGHLSAVLFSELPLSNWKVADPIRDINTWVGAFSAPGLEDFPKSRKAGSKFLDVLSPYVKDLNTERIITHEEWKSIFYAQNDFHNVLKQEIADNFVFMLTPIGAYSVKTLVNSAEHHLSDSARKTVGDKTKDDFKFAGYCLALDMWTACGFHSMRAVEAQARRYHKTVIGGTIEVDWTLDPLINGNSGRKQFGLRDQWKKEGAKDDSPLALIISLLTAITHIYRNPIMHPEMTLDAETAKKVFDTAALAISAMEEDKETRESAPKAAAVP